MKKLCLVLLVLSSVFLGCSSATEEKAQKIEEPIFEKVASVQGAEALQAGPEGLYIITADQIFLMEDNKIRPWLNLSNRSQQIWGLAFSENWLSDQLFYVYYHNLIGIATLAEGISGSDGAEWRRPVLRRPSPIGGGLQTDNRLLWLSDNQNLLRIEPYIKEGAPYSVPGSNPGGKERWTLLPAGKWQIDFLGNDLLIWGEDTQGQSLLWQRDMKELRGNVLRPKEADWSSLACDLFAGYGDGIQYSFVDSCSGEILVWQNGEMEKSGQKLDGLLSLSADTDNIYALLESGEILVQKQSQKGGAR